MDSNGQNELIIQDENIKQQVFVGILKDDDFRKQDTEAEEYIVPVLQHAIEMCVLLDEYKVPAYVSIGQDFDDGEITFRNNTFKRFEEQQAQDLFNRTLGN